MSNLKLPVMSYDVLSTMSGTIAYATTVSQYDDHVAIFHHGHLIGEVWQGGVWLSTAGYDTATTTARLNRILIDNLPGTPYRIALRNGVTQLLDTRIKHPNIIPVGRGLFIYDNLMVTQDNVNSVAVIIEKVA